MPAPLSIDLRQRVIAAIEAGASRRQTAERFGVGVASAIRWHARYRPEGQTAPKPMGGDHLSQRLEAHGALILRLYKERRDIFLRELREALQEHGVRTSTSALTRFFVRHGITRKKGRCTLKNRPART